MCCRLGSRESCSATDFQPEPESPSPCEEVCVGGESRDNRMVTNVHEDYSSGVTPLGGNGQ